MVCPRCGTKTDSWPCPECGFPVLRIIMMKKAEESRKKCHE